MPIRKLAKKSFKSPPNKSVKKEEAMPPEKYIFFGFSSAASISKSLS